MGFGLSVGWTWVRVRYGSFGVLGGKLLHDGLLFE